MATESHKPQWDIQNIGALSSSLKQTAVNSTTTYTAPTYTFDITPSATASVSASDHLVQCTVGVFGPRPYISTTGFTEHGIVSCEIIYSSYASHHINAVSAPSAPNKGTLRRASPQEIEMATILQDLLSSSIQLAQMQKHEVFISVVLQQSSGCQWYDLTFIVNAVSAALVTSGIALFDMVSAATVYLLPNLDNMLLEAASTQNTTTPNHSALTNHTQQNDTEELSQFSLSVYPPTPLVLNLIAQAKVRFNPISMTITYLPSLEQITFSKLQGQIHNNASVIASLMADAQTGKKEVSVNQSPWGLLTQSSLDLCKIIHSQQKSALKTRYVDLAITAASGVGGQGDHDNGDSNDEETEQGGE